uniref:Uncharacterized protein n=1 Tax=Nelumbo nucifera TaxID=4432 RepID=A0A822ZRR2_NELNU|nr:TPA_asm: hypothetical protein HUJ06_004269 [Nelumbo nucifera]
MRISSTTSSPNSRNLANYEFFIIGGFMVLKLCCHKYGSKDDSFAGMYKTGRVQCLYSELL